MRSRSLSRLLLDSSRCPWSDHIERDRERPLAHSKEGPPTSMIKPRSLRRSVTLGRPLKLLTRMQTSAAGFDLALIIGGCGWSLATLGATQWVLARGAPRWLLALHDFALFAAAVCGALAATAVV